MVGSYKHVTSTIIVNNTVISNTKISITENCRNSKSHFFFVHVYILHICISISECICSCGHKMHEGSIERFWKAKSIQICATSMLSVIFCNLFIGWKGRDDTPKLVERYMNKELRLDEFVTHHMELEKVNEAFDMLLAGKRCVFNF